MPPRSNSPRESLTSTSGLNTSTSTKPVIIFECRSAQYESEDFSLVLTAVGLSFVPCPVILQVVAARPQSKTGQWPCSDQYEEHKIDSRHQATVGYLLLFLRGQIKQSEIKCAFRTFSQNSGCCNQSHHDLQQLPILRGIMSLHPHYHQQQQQQQPSASNTASVNSVIIASTSSAAATTTATTASQQQFRSSSTSPTHHQRFFHLRHHHQQHQFHQYLPPRPPSTTSSGSLSTCGFPDDLPDELPQLPSTPQETGGGTGTSNTQGGTSALYTFHPAHHSLLYHRHTSPHFPPQHHLIHHHQQHYSIPPPTQSHHHHSSHHQHSHHAAHQSSIPVEHPLAGTGGAGGNSRAASRTTYVGNEDEESVRGLEEDNLLLVDNSVGVQDAVYLDPVTTDNFLTNVVQRFKRDFIYTYVGEGTLLVSVNPYKPLSIFSPRVKAAYRNISNPFQLPPHIYGQLCLILQRNTSSLERTQTLLLTGESGSGKSTNLSYLLDFLATKQESPFLHAHQQQPCRSRRNSGRSTSGGGGAQVLTTSSKAGGYYLSVGSLSRHHHNSGGTGGGGGSGRASSLSLTAPSAGGGGYSQNTPYALPNLALSLLQGNFLLNAFGNCKTGKNWDASRFGKLAQLQIDFLGNVCGGRLVTYQLEKWRVQGPIAGGDYERNFHIFYIIVVGADSSTLKNLRLTRNLETYAMLNVKNHSSFLNASQTSTPSAPFCPHDHYYSLKGAKGPCSTSTSSHYENCFQLVKTTLNALLPTTSQINSDHVFRMLAAILKLNNLVFAPVANIDGTEGCDVTNDQDLHDIGILLQILPGPHASGHTITSPSSGNNNSNHLGNHHPLKSILSTRRVSRTDGSVANIELTASESTSLRNALTISLYTRLFSWLSKQISVKSVPSANVGAATCLLVPPSPVTPPKHNLLNIVDFYGFEVFQTNSLEQFLINFTNEKIHYVLADLRLRMLQEEFVRDGLEWITIDTATTSSASPNSVATAAGKLIDLVEENCHGLLSIFANCANDHELERQCARRFSTQNSSASMSSRETAQQQSHDSGKESACSTSSRQKSSPPPASSSSTTPLLVEYLHQSFRLRHWAGPVVYSTKHFASKNRDTLPPHLPHQLYTWTSDPLLRALFSHDGRTPPMEVGSTAGSSRLLSTSNMELSLRNLFQKCCVSSKPSHHRIYYIRCLKPNELSQPEVCETALLKHQVRYHRLIDFVRVYRDGFTYNMGAFEFLERYKLLSLNTWPNWRHPQDVRLGIQVLMKDLQMKEGLDWCFGGGTLLHHHPSSSVSGSGETLKVYLKGQRILSELEDFRRERLDDLALLIQKIWRGYRDWRHWNRMKNAHLVICRVWRNYLQCKRKEQRKLWKQMRNAVKLIQNRYILWKRRLFLRQLILQVRAELQVVNLCQGGGPLSVATTATPGTTGMPGGMLSPISKDWPHPPSYLEEASYHLKRVFHRWRCRLYRSRFNEVERAKMAEKVTASMLFRDKKISYTRSISHPFLGDYIRLRQNSQWRRTAMMMMLQTVTQSQQLPHVPSTASAAVAAALEEAVRSAAAAVDESGTDGTSAGTPRKPLLLPSQQLQIVFADLINKITRSSGKFLPIVLVVTTTQIMILDPRTLNIKYKIPASEIWRLSMSPYGDDICVLHLHHPRIVGGGSVVGPGEQGNLFGGVLSDDDDAYYQFGDEPSPTVGNFGAGGCMCSSGNTSGAGAAGIGGGYYSSGGGDSPPSSQQQHQCQGSGGCGLFGGGGGGSGGGDTDSGHYATSEIVKVTKGDLVLHTCHLIEMVTKIYLVVKNATGRGPEILISNEFPAIFNNQRVQLYFRYYSKKPHVPPSKSVAITAASYAAPLSGGDTIISTVASGGCAPITTSSEDYGGGRPALPASTVRIPGPLSLSFTPLPDGPLSSNTKDNPASSCSSSVPPPPPAPAAALVAGKEEPVIPPSQIKITRKKSTRMEFLISGGGAGHS